MLTIPIHFHCGHTVPLEFLVEERALRKKQLSLASAAKEALSWLR